MACEQKVKSILYIGAYQSLMLLRAEMLRHAGFKVVTAENIRQAAAATEDSSFDLILICHTFSPEERAQMAIVLQQHAPQTFVMPLTKAYEAIIPDPPETFVNLVRSAARQATHKLAS
jgi:DNA-binding NtrC family response regulator